jgi:hypothetical protein
VDSSVFCSWLLCQFLIDGNFLDCGFKITEILYSCSKIYSLHFRYGNIHILIS